MGWSAQSGALDSWARCCELTFASLGRIATSHTLEDLERLRRSLAMLSPGQPAGLTREEAMRPLADLQQARRGFERLEAGLRRLLDEGEG